MFSTGTLWNTRILHHITTNTQTQPENFQETLLISSRFPGFPGVLDTLYLGICSFRDSSIDVTLSLWPVYRDQTSTVVPCRAANQRHWRTSIFDSIRRTQWPPVNEDCGVGHVRPQSIFHANVVTTLPQSDSITYIAAELHQILILVISSAGWAFHISWSKCCLCVCLDVNQSGTNCNRCKQRLVTLHAQN